MCISYKHTHTNFQIWTRSATDDLGHNARNMKKIPSKIILNCLAMWFAHDKAVHGNMRSKCKIIPLADVWITQEIQEWLHDSVNAEIRLDCNKSIIFVLARYTRYTWHCTGIDFASNAIQLHQLVHRFESRLFVQLLFCYDSSCTAVRMRSRLKQKQYLNGSDGPYLKVEPVNKFIETKKMHACQIHLSWF